jgi:hypothetical protein
MIAGRRIGFNMEILIKTPCNSCDFLSWEEENNLGWYCNLFETDLLSLDGKVCTIGEKDEISQCMECSVLEDSYKREVNNDLGR